MGFLLVIGVLSLVFGFLFLFAPQAITKFAAWSNRLIARTDDVVNTNSKAAGVLLIVAGLFILWAYFVR
jgi:uncharacterized membrane protein HdeD (DUF308 family)